MLTPILFCRGDIHPTTTGGTHHPARHPPGSTVIGSGRIVVVTDDEPHITVAVSSRHFPSLDNTYHILTKMSDPTIRNLRSTDELLNEELYPQGFPSHLLRSAGLSEKSAGFPTPKQAYDKIVKKWKRNQDRKARKAAMWEFDDEDGDDEDRDDNGSGPASAPRGSGPGGPPPAMAEGEADPDRLTPPILFLLSEQSPKRVSPTTSANHRIPSTPRWTAPRPHSWSRCCITRAAINGRRKLERRRPKRASCPTGSRPWVQRFDLRTDRPPVPTPLTAPPGPQRRVVQRRLDVLGPDGADSAIENCSCPVDIWVVEPKDVGSDTGTEVDWRKMERD